MMRRKFETRFVAALLSCALITGMTADCTRVYADESTEPVAESTEPTIGTVEDMTDHDNTIQIYDGFLFDSDHYVNPSEEVYHDNEVTKIEGASESIKTMEAQAANAQKAADKAADAVGELEAAVEELKVGVNNADSAAKEIKEGDVAAAKSEASDAAEKVGKIYDAAKALGDETVSSYNNKVEEDQKAIDNLGAKKTEDEKAVSIDEMIAPGTENGSVSALVEQAEQYADLAETEAENTKAALEAALAIESDEVNEKIEENVSKAVDAAFKASNAAEAAKELCDNAQTALDNAIKEYNLYAMSYGMPLYGETEITYLDERGDLTEEAKQMLKEAGLLSKDGMTRKELKDKIGENALGMGEITLDDSNIKKAEAELETATGKYQTAKEAADKAFGDISDASEAIDKAVGEADKEATKTTDYYVDPAKEALEKATEAREAKEKEIPGLESELEKKNSNVAETENAVKPSKEAEYEAELAKLKEDETNAKKAYDEADKAYNNASVLAKVWNSNNVSSNRNNAKSKYDNAKSEREKYEKNKETIISEKIANDSSVQAAKEERDTAQKNLKIANETLTNLIKTEEEKNAALEQAEATKAAYIKAAGDKATKEFLDNMATVLKANSDMINQVEYDRVVNEEVNKAQLSIISADKIRIKMNKMYMKEFWDKLANTFTITQWAISTEGVNEEIDTIKAECTKNITNYLEELAMAEANWAKVSADASAEAKENALKATNIEAQKKAIENSGAAISTAEKDIKGARQTYDEAVGKLGELKDVIDGLDETKNIFFDEINKKLAKAQLEVNNAKETLEKANAAKNAAENYAAWAQSLLDRQQMQMFSILAGDNPDDDMEFVIVPGKDGDYVEVPYSIYKAYVNEMYENYKFNDNENFGVISTDDENMKVLFWELGKDGTLTGNYYDDEAKLPKSGKYFIGNTFGFEDCKDKEKLFRVEGVIYKYNKPSNNVPGTPGGNVNGGNNGGDNGDDNGGNNGGNAGATVNNDVVVAANGTAAGRRIVASADTAEEVIVSEEENNQEVEEVVEEKTEEKKDVEEKKTVKIDDNDTPLAAAPIDEKNFPWWILLLVAVLVVAGTTTAVVKKQQAAKRVDTK